jgi:hypothetical protein
LLAAVLPASAQPFAGVSLRVRDQTAPPGGTFQLVVDLTEPRPIIVGNARLDFNSRFALRGIVLPGTPDAAAAGVVTTGGLVLHTVSPGDFGLNPTAPIIALSIGVPETVAIGTKTPLTLDSAASQWTGPLGVYPQEIKQGTFTASGRLSITDVIPGGGALPAGSTISVLGLGFQRGATVEIDGIDVSSTTFVDATRIDVVTSAAVQLDGTRVSVRNPDHARVRYYSYLRATSLGESAVPLLAATEVAYPLQPLSFAMFPAAAASPQNFVGVAVQNQAAFPTQVQIALQTAATVVATTAIALPPRAELSRALSELFPGVTAGADTVVTVRASSPVQILGLLGDTVASSVLPVLPTASF